MRGLEDAAVIEERADRHLQRVEAQAAEVRARALGGVEQGRRATLVGQILDALQVVGEPERQQVCPRPQPAVHGRVVLVGDGVEAEPEPGAIRSVACEHALKGSGGEEADYAGGVGIGSEGHRVRPGW